MVRGSGGSLARLLDGGSVAGLTDGQLLDRFSTRRGDAAEAAFEALVKRHGPMVARVCRRNLRDENDVEDAFQATFLVLVRRADSLGERDLLAPWLYGVAHRVARKARAVALKRRDREGVRAGVDPPARFDSSAAVDVELAPVLHEEVNRLPAKYREPVILCHLQGLTHAEAAHELAWPVGTVSVRLVRARQILADRLTRRGVTASVATVAAALAAEGSVAAAGLVAPTAWVHAVAVAAVAAAGGLSLTTATTAGPISAGAATLARRTSMTMLLSAWKWFLITPTIALATATSAGLFGSAGQGDDPQVGAKPAVAKVEPAATAPPTEINVNSRSPAPGQDQDQLIADNVIINGKLNDLAKTVAGFEASNPDATYRLQIVGENGPITFRRAGVSGRGTQFTSRAAPTELSLALTGPASVAPGQNIEYTLTVTNLGPPLTEPIVITAALPHEGGKLARGPMPAKATFLSKDRKLVWKVDRLNQGQSARYKFLYETSTPGQYRCVAEVVTEPFHAVDELITAVGQPAAPPTPTMPEEEPQPTAAAPPLVVSPPIIALSDGRFDLDPPPGFFDIAALKPSEPVSLRPVRVGQEIDIEVLEALPGRPITGIRVVRTDGTVGLGFYGDIHVEGLNRDQIKIKVLERLIKYLHADVLGLITFKETNPDKALTVLPVESNRVFVDDQPRSEPPASEPKQPATKSAPLSQKLPLSGRIPVRAGQTILVEVLDALPGRPITGERIVRPDGTISLGFYGDLTVAGLTRDEIKVRVVEHLRRFLTDEMLGLKVVDARTNQIKDVAPAQTDRVFVEDLVAYDPAATTPPAADGKVQVGQILSVEVLEALPGRPITGHRIVHPDGSINLGFYGEVAVVGLTRNEVKAKVIEHLRAKLTDEQLGLVQINAEGARQTVAPADSAAVFVDDVVSRPEPKPTDTLQKQVAELSGKLDAALSAIKELRDEKANPRPTPAPAELKPEIAPPGEQDQAADVAPGLPLNPALADRTASAVRLVSIEDPAPADPTVELNRVLAAWDKQSAQTRSLQVSFERVDKSAAWGVKAMQGTMMLQSPDRAYLEFKQALTGPDGKPRRKLNATGRSVLEVEREPTQRFVCTGKELIHYEWDEKTMYAYPLDPRTGKLSWPLSGSWPFDGFEAFLKLPFLFGMTTADVRQQQYDFRWLKQDGKSDLIKITSRDQTDRLGFEVAYLWLDRSICSPTRLFLLPRNSPESQEFRYTRVDRNQPVDAAFFQPVKTIKGWKTIEMSGWKMASPSMLDLTESLGNWTEKFRSAVQARLNDIKTEKKP